MQSALAEITPLGVEPAWIVLASAVLFVIYLTLRPKRRDPLASQPFRTSLVQQRALERDMQNVIVELSEMTRQMSAQLETRAAKLEQLMRDADAKIVELQEAAKTARQTEALTEIIAEVNAAAGVSAGSARPAMRLVSDASDHSEDRWAEVYRLGDEGLTLPEIARRLSRPKGEVELILALRPKPAAQPASAEQPAGLASGH
jgi:hypothetical protein